ncbi:MAG: tetratricopeptide repeat protein [Saprospiraceae bacterium]|nr:tetratricopeptide repeat protein [Saprospiraceae bacterium]
MRYTVLILVFVLFDNLVSAQTKERGDSYAWFGQVKSLIENFKFAEADSLILQIVSNLDTTDVLGAAKLYHNKAHLALNRGQLDEAIQNLDKASLYYGYTDTIPVFDLYEFYFGTYQRKGELLKAIDYLKLLLPLTKTIPDKDTKKLHILNNLVLSFTDNDDLDSASYYLSKADTLIGCTKVSNYERILYWQWRANLFNALNLPSESSKAYEMALQIAKDSLANHPRVGDILVEYGLLNSQTGNFEAAIHQYSEANSIYQSVYNGPHARMIAPSINIANYYSRKGDLKKALTLYTEAEQLIRALGPSYAGSLSMVDNNRGNCYKNAGRHEEALEWYQKSLQARITSQGENSGSVAQSRFNVANCLVEMHQDSTALQCFKQTKSWFLKNRKSQLQPKYLELCTAMASAFTHINQMDSSLHYLTNGNTLWNRLSPINQEYELEQYIKLQVA